MQQTTYTPAATIAWASPNCPWLYTGPTAPFVRQSQLSGANFIWPFSVSQTWCWISMVGFLTLYNKQCEYKFVKKMKLYCMLANASGTYPGPPKVTTPHDNVTTKIHCSINHISIIVKITHFWEQQFTKHWIFCLKKPTRGYGDEERTSYVLLKCSKVHKSANEICTTRQNILMIPADIR